MASTDNTETVATFTYNGKTYEIDHLGIGFPSQYGLFAVYCDGIQLCDFEVNDVGVETGIPDEAELVRLAREALATNEVHDFAGTEG